MSMYAMLRCAVCSDVNDGTIDVMRDDATDVSQDTVPQKEGIIFISHLVTFFISISYLVVPRHTR